MTIFEKRKKYEEAREKRDTVELENIEAEQEANKSEELLLEATDILISDSNRIARGIAAIVKEQENIEMDDGEKVPAIEIVQGNLDEIQEYIPRLREELGLKESVEKGLPLPKMINGRTMDISDWFRFMNRDATKFRADILLLIGYLSTLVVPENNLDTGDKKELAKDAVKLIATIISFLKASGVPDNLIEEAIDNENKMES